MKSTRLNSGYKWFTQVVLGMVLVLIYPVQLYAQPDISTAEYYFDTDPGFGSGLPLSFTQATSFDISLDLVHGLSPGYHMIGVRALNANGAWGFTEKRPFFIPSTTGVDPPPADITAIEYFIDTDPGHGNGTAIVVTTSSLIDIASEIIETSSELPGYHSFGIRAMNSDGIWSMYEHRMFFIPSSTAVDPPPADIIEMEYFFDNDPGFGSATAISVTTGQLIDINELIFESLSTGYHTFHVRAKNADGTWGVHEKRPIFIPEAQPVESVANITRVEYFIDGIDPGIGNAIELVISPDTLIDLDPSLVPTEPTLIDGQHTITFRAMNELGQWGMAEIDTFDVLDDCTQPIAAFTPQIACAGQPIIFSDSSQNLQIDAQYRWYLNGDEIVDDTTVGDATYTYTFPGTYVVALAIRQGTICFDSITTTIDVQPLPLAVFSTTGTVVNETVNFSASASNLPPGAYWEWDFDEDGVTDDTTEGNTSFTYTSVGTYNPTLTITDGLGCEITVTNTVSINNSGGAGTPSVDFLADNGCTGNEISFVDLSQNISGDAVYSWDFDGDGIEDSNTSGNQIYTYSSSGTFTATLLIDMGGSTISADHAIEIADIPVTDFSAIDVCIGSGMTFTDLSTNTGISSVYMWDFDNDGTVDSNTQTDITFNYPVAGSYIVSLVISNGYGCEHEIVKQVNVIDMPVPDFDWDVVCTGDLISFSDLSTDISVDATYSWDLDGDGTEDLSTFGDTEFTYAAAGAYNPSLTVTNPGGCATTISKTIEIVDRPITSFEITARCYGQESQFADLSQNVNANAVYSWDFNNDGLTDDTTVGDNTFTYTEYDIYTTRLTVDNGSGCVASAEQLVKFSDAATPDFTTNKLCQGEEVIFTNLSTDLETAAVYSWDFDGDGNEDSAYPGSTGFIYSEAGTYDATLTIDNGGQCLAYKTVTLDITPPPSVDLGPDMLLCSEGNVTFDAGTGYSSYLWPDGSTDQTLTVNQVGDYIVRIQDAKNCYNTDTISVQLRGAPIPSFDYVIELSLEGIRVHFTNNSNNSDSYSWDYGDGTTSTDTEGSYVYSDFSFYQTSVYTVCLTAINSCEEQEFCEDIFISPTQLMQESGDVFDAYPNPAQQYIYLELKSTSGFNKIGLFDTYGKMHWMSDQPLKRYEVSTESLSRGIYYFILEKDNQYLFKRIVKN